METSVQIAALLEGRKLSERAARWLLHSRRPPFDIAQTIDYFADGVLAVGQGLPGLLAGRDLAGYEDRCEMFASRGVPDALANRLASMVPAYSAFDIVDIARGTGQPGAGGGRGLLRPGRPAADRPAPGHDHRAAPR